MIPPCRVQSWPWMCCMGTDDNMFPKDSSQLSAESNRKCSGFRPANGAFQRKQTQTVGKEDRKWLMRISHTHTLSVYVNHLACIWQLNEAEYTVGFEVNGLTKFNKFPRPNQGKSAEPSFLDISEDSKHLTRGCEKKIDMIQFSFRIINIAPFNNSLNSRCDIIHISDFTIYFVLTK